MTKSAQKSKPTYSIWQWAGAGIGLGRLLKQSYGWAHTGFSFTFLQNVGDPGPKSIALVVSLMLLLVFIAVLYFGADTE